MADALGTVSRAGQNAYHQIDMLESGMRLSQATGGDFGRALYAIDALLVKFGQDSESASKWVNALATAQQEFGISNDSMLDGMQRSAGIINTAGLQYDFVAGALSVAYQNGMSMATATSGLSGIFTDMMNPTSNLRNAMYDLGVEVLKNDDGTTNAQESMVKFMRALNDADPVLQEQINNTMNLSGSNATLFANLLDNIDAIDEIADMYYYAMNAGEEYARVTGMIDARSGGLTEAWGRLRNMGTEVLLQINDLIGAPVIGWIEGVVEKIFEFLNTEEGMSAIGGVIEAVGRAFFAVAEVVGELFKALAPLIYEALPVIMELFQRIMDVVVDLIRAFAPMIEQIFPILVEIVQAVVGWFVELIEALAPLIERILPPLIEILGNLWTIFKTLMDEVLMPFINRVIPILIDVFGWLADAINVVVGAVTDFVTGLFNSEGESSRFVEIVSGAFTWLRDTLATVFGAIRGLWESVVGRFREYWDENGEQLMEAVRNAFQWLQERLEPVMNFIRNMWETTWSALKSVVQIMWGHIQNAVQIGVDIILAIVDIFIGIFTGDWERFWNGIANLIGGVWDMIVLGLQTSWEMIKLAFRTAGEIIMNILRYLWDTVRSGWDAMVGFVSGFIDAMVEFVAGGFRRMWEGVVERMTAIRDSIAELWGRAVEFLTNIDLREIGRNIINGLIGGITGMVDNVVDSIRNVGSRIADGFRSFFRISSPSGLFRDYGRNIQDGLSEGLEEERSRSRIGNAVTSVANGITGAFRRLLNISSPSKVFSGYGDSIIDGLCEGLGNGETSVGNAITSVGKKVINGFAVATDSRSGSSKQFLKQALMMTRGLEQGIENGTNNVLQTLQQFAVAMIAKLRHATNPSIFTDMSNNITGGLMEGINSGLPSVLNVIIQFSESLISTLERATEPIIFKNMGRNIPNGINYGVSMNSGAVLESVRRLAENIVTTFNNWLPSWQFERLGHSINNGIRSGLYGTAGSVFNSVAWVANNIVNQFRRSMQISSPSRIFKTFGENTGEGYLLGLPKYFDMALDELENYADKIIDIFENVEVSLAGIDMPDLNVGYNINRGDLADGYAQSSEQSNMILDGLNRLGENIANMSVTLDGRETIGGLRVEIDRQLGDINSRVNRGVASD